VNESDIQSRTLLNLDSEEEGALYVGCSGGVDTAATWEATFEPSPSGTRQGLLKVSGLRGGHSGLEIDKGRGNSIKIINRALIPLADLGVRLSSLDAGNKHNAIPREAEAIVYVPARRWDQAVGLVADCCGTIRAELWTVEPDFSMTLTPISNRKGRVLKKSLQKKICQTITAVPHGVIKMSADIPGLVETSTNLAVVKTARKSVRMVTSQRSSVASEIKDIRQTVATVFELGGADEIDSGDGYPGWKPNMDSEILKFSKGVYQSMFHREPEVKAIHAGLECGIIGQRCPGMDMVSFGPTLEGVHSPDEKIYLESVTKFYDFLLAVLKELK
jgi:dipeptidase D